jgi:hypothetical protein
MHYLNVEGKLIPIDSRSNDLWFQHFAIAIAVSDMDRAYAHLRSFPIKPISMEPQTIPPDNKASAGVRAFKFKDPDGHNLELIWFPLDKGQDKWRHSLAPPGALRKRSNSLIRSFAHSKLISGSACTATNWRPPLRVRQSRMGETTPVALLGETPRPHWLPKTLTGISFGDAESQGDTLRVRF